jgi:hypothetical protein
MRELRTYGTIQGGKLKISYRDKFDQAIKNFPDCRIELIVKKLYRKRSTEQNRYYWGVIVNEFRLGYYDMTGEEISTETAHELLKQKCNAKEVINEKTGEVLTVGQSTTQMTTIEMAEYWERCCKWISEWFGRYVAAPNEQTELFKN